MSRLWTMIAGLAGGMLIGGTTGCPLGCPVSKLLAGDYSAINSPDQDHRLNLSNTLDVATETFTRDGKRYTITYRMTRDYRETLFDAGTDGANLDGTETDGARDRDSSARD